MDFDFFVKNVFLYGILGISIISIIIELLFYFGSEIIEGKIIEVLPYTYSKFDNQYQYRIEYSYNQKSYTLITSVLSNLNNEDLNAKVNQPISIRVFKLVPWFFKVNSFYSIWYQIIISLIFIAIISGIIIFKLI